jgi:protein O-GlcNAc transferase
MYRRALELDKALGRKYGMAGNYYNLGDVYKHRGDLTQAEAMYRQALILFQEMGATPFIEKVRALLDELRVQGAP